LARRRFFVDSIAGAKAELRGDEARHLTRVLRAEPGQRYEICDNQSVYLAEIEEARGDQVIFRVVERVEAAGLPVRIALYAALIKFDRFEWMIEKVTELGAEVIVPVETARCEKGLMEASRKRSERWMRIARESSQQSRRVRMPEILPAVRFEQALRAEAEQRYFLEEGGAPPLLRLVPETVAEGERVALLVGPEGGWTEPERNAAATAGWRPGSLGPQVLRAETASMAGVAVLTSSWTARALTTIEVE
jgi:16S rRNA (uracil1498-N3)-methyltransferase